MLGLRRQSSEPGWLGFAPLAGRVHMAHVVCAEGVRPVLRWADTADWADPVRTLHGLRRSRAINRLRSVALLQRHQYQWLPMDAPEVPREEWADALRWSLKDLVDFPVDTAGIAVLAVPDAPSALRRAQLIAVAAAHAQLAPLAAAGAEAGTPWQAIDVPETALRNIATLLGTPGHGQALLHMGDAHSTLVVTADGELLVARHIDVSLAQLLDTNEDTRQQAFERASLALQRTLDSVERQFSHVRLAGVQVAPGAPLAAFIAYASELVYVPVTAFDLAQFIDLSAVPALADAAVQAAYLPAIGAALRGD